MRADDAVALARGRFESPSVQDLDPPVAARDQPVALERPQDHGDGGTLHVEHHGEELLLECEGIGALHAVHCMICSRLACAYRLTTLRKGPATAVSLTKRAAVIDAKGPFATC